MTERLEKILGPMSSRLGNQRHLQAISNGMMMSLGLIVVGSLFLIIANPPVNLDLVDASTANIFMKGLIAWKQWAVANYQTITIPYTMTMGLIGLVTCFGVSYCLADSYKMKAAIHGIISMCVFLMVAAPVNEGQLSMAYLGADGLFVALVIGLVSVELCRFVEKKMVFSFPEGVPQAVTDFVNSLLPLAFNIFVIYGLNLAIISFTGKTLPEMVMSVLTPAISSVDNVWAYMAIFAFSNILWLFGINGSSIIFPIVFTLGITNTGLNAELVNAGQEATQVMNLQMYRYAVLGGGGNTLGLVLLMCFSKIKHLKSIGRLSLLPGICGINEPVIFGGPIVLNPILAIPFVLMPCLSIGLGYMVQKVGLVQMGYIVDPSFTPFFAQGFLSGLDVRNVIFMLALVALSVAVYYPFFKVYEKQLIEKNAKN